MAELFAPMDGADVANLDRMRAVVRAAAEKAFRLKAGWVMDATLLQRLVDAQVFSPTQRQELQCLGVALGDLLVRDPDFRWVMITDDHGCDPTVRWRRSSVCVHALTMISKRVEHGEAIDIAELVAVATERARDLAALEREA